MIDKKVMLVASPGGHFVQLSLIAHKMNVVRRAVIGTYPECPKFMPCDEYYVIPDFSRSNIYVSIYVFYLAVIIMVKEKPDIIITTGAAPGLIFALVARLFKVKSLWIDSIANTKNLSLSGKIASFFGVITLSQWPLVAESENVLYKGCVI
jgi:hypothetical protein